MGDLILTLSVSPPMTGSPRNLVTHIDAALNLGCRLILNCIERLSVVLASERD